MLYNACRAFLFCPQRAQEKAAPFSWRLSRPSRTKASHGNNSPCSETHGRKASGHSVARGGGLRDTFGCAGAGQLHQDQNGSRIAAAAASRMTMEGIHQSGACRHACLGKGQAGFGSTDDARGAKSAESMTCPSSRPPRPSRTKPSHCKHSDCAEPRASDPEQPDLRSDFSSAGARSRHRSGAA